jgi:hypothetical protein
LIFQKAKKKYIKDVLRSKVWGDLFSLRPLPVRVEWSIAFPLKREILFSFGCVKKLGTFGQRLLLPLENGNVYSLYRTTDILCKREQERSKQPWALRYFQ